MIGLEAVCARFGRLQVATLRLWVERGWVRPRQQGEALAFDAADVARVALICDLSFEIALDDDSLPVVLSLLDQLYDARRDLGLVMAAVEELPGESRRALREAIARKAERPEHGAA